MRPWDFLLLVAVLAQALCGLVLVAWRSRRRERRADPVDLTDLTALSRSPDVLRHGH